MHRDEKERKAKAIEASVRASSIGGLTWLHPSHCGRLIGVLLLCAQKMACKSGKSKIKSETSAKRAVENATIAKTAEMQKSAEMQKIADQQKMEKATELMLVRKRLSAENERRVKRRVDMQAYNRRGQVNAVGVWKVRAEVSESVLFEKAQAAAMITFKRHSVKRVLLEMAVKAKASVAASKCAAEAAKAEAERDDAAREMSRRSFVAALQAERDEEVEAEAKLLADAARQMYRRSQLAALQIAAEEEAEAKRAAEQKAKAKAKMAKKRAAAKAKVEAERAAARKTQIHVTEAIQQLQTVHVVAVGLLRAAERCDAGLDAWSVLTATQPPGSAAGGQLALPGGKIKEDETQKGAARREIREELKVDVDEKDLTLVGTYSYSMGFKRFMVHTYACAKFKNEPVAAESQELLAWVPMSREGLAEHLINLNVTPIASLFDCCALLERHVIDSAKDEKLSLMGSHVHAMRKLQRSLLVNAQGTGWFDALSDRIQTARMAMADVWHKLATTCYEVDDDEPEHRHIEATTTPTCEVAPPPGAPPPDAPPGPPEQTAGAKAVIERRAERAAALSVGADVSSDDDSDYIPDLDGHVDSDDGLETSLEALRSVLVQDGKGRRAGAKLAMGRAPSEGDSSNRVPRQQTLMGKKQNCLLKILVHRQSLIQDRHLTPLCSRFPLEQRRILYSMQCHRNQLLDLHYSCIAACFTIQHFQYLWTICHRPLHCHAITTNS